MTWHQALLATLPLWLAIGWWAFKQAKAAWLRRQLRDNAARRAEAETTPSKADDEAEAAIHEALIEDLKDINADKESGQ